MIFVRTWQPNVLIKEHPDRKPILTNLTADCGRTFSQITTPINRPNVNDE